MCETQQRWANDKAILKDLRFMTSRVQRACLRDHDMQIDRMNHNWTLSESTPGSRTLQWASAHTRGPPGPHCTCVA